MSSERHERQQVIIHDSDGYVMDNYPVHFAGMAAFLRNDSADSTTIIVQESADGATWDLVLVSTDAAAGLPSITMVGLSFACILFTSDHKYVRIATLADNVDGVYTVLCQFPPKPREPNVVY